MNKLLFLLVFLTLIAGFLKYTNPSKEEFVSFVKEEFYKPTDNSLLEKLTSKLFSKAAELDAKTFVNRKDYFVFSVFSYNGILTGNKTFEYIGIVHQFYLLD